MRCTFALLLSVALAGPAGAVTIFTAQLDQAQEVPPSGSSATGTATLILNDAETELSYDILITGLDWNAMFTPLDLQDDITNLHIHNAPPGVNGDVVFGIHGPQHDVDDRVVTTPSGSVRFQGIWDAADEAFGASSLASLLAELESGNLYLNVHTPAFPNGEIRGQIVPEPATAGLLALGLVAMGVARRRA